MSIDTTLAVLISSNVACLFLGFLFGRAAQATVRIEESMSDTEATDQAAPPSSSRDRSYPGRVPLIIIAVAVVSIGAITATLGVLVTRNQDRLTGCVAGYSNALADTLQATRDASADANRQLDAVFQAVLDAYDDIPSEGQAKVRAAIEAHQEAREKVREAQADNPLPDAPRDACAELLE